VTTPPGPEYLTLEDLLDLCADLGLLVRDLGLVESAVARPRTSLYGEDAYPTLDAKAAALLHSIVKNHALVDGNTRLGWASAMLFLDINGQTSALTQPQATDLVIQVAASNVDVGWIAAELVVVPR
jgi:death-on-curing protein